MPSKRTFTDQMGREVIISDPPKRIISLVPSQTELLFDLGLKEQVIGITKFCIHPADEVKYKIKIGGTKQLNMKLISSLQPDLIIANKEENERGQIEELAKHFPIWVSDVDDLGSALTMFKSVGDITGTALKANNIADDIGQLFADLLPGTPKKAAYLIWRKPYMLAGKGTFIDDMLNRCGLENITRQTRYPEVTAEDLIALQPDVVFLSSEPYPFKQKHVDELQLHLPAAKIYLVDGEMFSWYGSRMLLAVPYFKALIANVNG